MKSIYWSLLLSLGLVACSSDEKTETGVFESPVRFLSAITLSTRATETNFDAGDRIGVFAVKRTDANPTGALQAQNYADNVYHEYSGTYFEPKGEKITLPADGSELFYHAVYPHVSNCSNEFEFTVIGNQVDYNGYTRSDLMTAKTEATTEAEPILRFNHRLSNIIINLHYDAIPTEGVDVAVTNVKMTASVNLNKNTYIGIGETIPVAATAASNGTNSYRVILPPQTIAKETWLFAVKIGQKQYSFYNPDEWTWKSGRQYEYDLYVGNSPAAVFTGSINPWDTSDAVEEVIPPSILDDMETYIPIHRGKNPPSIEGIYLMEPMEAVYCSDGYFEPGDDNIVPSLLAFANQNNTNFTIEFAEKDGYGNLSVGDGAFISGSGDNFSVYFDTEGYTVVEEETILNTTALVISGTKTSTGIKDLYYAFVMVDKNDPNGHLMEVGAFRVFKDGDNLAANSTWDYFEQTRTHKWNGAKSRNDLIRAVK